MTPNQIADVKSMLRQMSEQNWFRFLPRITEIWKSHVPWLIRFGEVQAYDGPAKRVVRCSANFDMFMDEIYAPGIGEPKRLEVVVRELFQCILPVSPGSSYKALDRSAGVCI